ncbi:MAG: hypothetical protein EOQ69_19400 [Mesorhizobium sp.]|nr:MAG: hypothetical protein EOQ69_19400 [Mesorhizobium sp.]
MVATVGSISIDLVTNAAKFASGFKSSATTVEQQSGRMAKSIKAIETNTALAAGTLKTFMGGLAAGAGLAALTSLDGAFAKLKETISEFDEIASNAKTAGLQTDIYQALGFAAKQANIEQDSLNASLNIFAKNSGLAEKGTGALYAGLKKLNPELLQSIINAKDQEERLNLVADALMNARDATEQAALATTIFGKGGIEMTRILDQGRGSIDRLKQTAKELGIIIPEDLLKKAGELDDKLDLLSKVIDVNVGQSLIRLAPLLVGATQGFADFSKEFAHFSDQLAAFQANPSLEKFLALVRGDAKVGLLDRVAEAADTVSSKFKDSAADIEAQIAEVQQKLADLKIQADAGFEVSAQTDRALEDLDFLQKKLAALQASGISAANAIRASFAQAFRESENASMAALAAIQKRALSPSALPNVIRYGGDPNKIIIPGAGAPNVQSNVNGSGVNVTKYKSSGPWQNPNGATPAEWSQLSAQDKQDIYEGKTTYDKILYGTDQTADNTEETASNVSKLDDNTRGYFRDLGGGIGDGLTTINHTVSTLADLIGNEFGALPSYLIAALQANGGALNTGNISQPSSMFGDQWDPQHGSHVGDIINTGFRHTGGNVGSYHLSSYADDGSSNNQVTVQQPGNSYTLQYYAAPGDSLETTKQKARAAFDELVKAAASA